MVVVKTIAGRIARSDAGAAASGLGRVAHIGHAGVHKAIRRCRALGRGQTLHAHGIGGIANHAEGAAVAALGAGGPTNIADAMLVAAATMAVDDAIDTTVVRGIAKASRAIAIVLADRRGHALVGGADLSGSAIRIRSALNAYAALQITDRVAGTVAVAAASREGYTAVSQTLTARLTVLGLYTLSAKFGHGLAKLSTGRAIGIACARKVGLGCPARSASAAVAWVNRPRATLPA